MFTKSRRRWSIGQKTRQALGAALSLTFGLVATGWQGPIAGSTAGKLFADEKPSPVPAARDAARRRQSVNNLKMIGLAIHNYHNKYGYFPQAAILGKDGKTAHSWRVELLPFLDQQELFDMYKMEEPWDSKNNKKVLEKMPDVFRNPNDGSNKTNASYYGLRGAGTLFDGTKQLKMTQITDGTSNTLMVVEAKRDIPWTKPEDIAYDTKKDPPKLGGHFTGGFHALLIDGSAHFISEKVDKETLKHLIEIADGHAVTVPEDAPGSNSEPTPTSRTTTKADAAKVKQKTKQAK